VHAGPADQVHRPLIRLDDQIGEDHRSTVGDGLPRLDPGAAVLAGLDHDGCPTVTGHDGVAHWEGVLGRLSGQNCESTRPSAAMQSCSCRFSAG
jgi:hypothetical protein